MGDFADATFLEPLHGGALVGCRSDLRAQLSDYPPLDRGPSKGSDFRDVMAEWFLAVNMFAALNRTVGNRKMHVIGNGNVYRIDAAPFLLQQVPPIGVQSRTGNSLCRLLQITRVDIA